MSDRVTQIVIGAVAAAAVAVVGYLAIQGVLTPELAAAASAIIAFIGGFLTPKSVTPA